MVRGLTQYTRYPCWVNRSWTSASEWPCSTCCRRWPCSSATLTRNCAIRYRLPSFPFGELLGVSVKCNILFPKPLLNRSSNVVTQVTDLLRIRALLSRRYRFVSRHRFSDAGKRVDESPFRGWPLAPPTARCPLPPFQLPAVE